MYYVTLESTAPKAATSVDEDVGYQEVETMEI